jgi:hypothetical protein
MADNQGVAPAPAPSDHPGRAKSIVYDFIKDDLRRLDRHGTFFIDEVFVVWFCYILGGWKALVSTTLPDGRYYEVTYNSRKEEVYLDVYVKRENHTVIGRN